MENSSNESNIQFKARDVFVRVSYTKIFQVDTHNQKFHAEVIVESKWFDPDVNSLNFDVTKLKWKPELYIDNAVNDPSEKTSYKIVNEDGKFMINEIKVLKGHFSENLELENFPLDIQSLTLVITTKNSTNKINFVISQPKFTKQNISNTLDKSMWHLHDMIRIKNNNIQREYSFGKREYPAIEITCQVFRHSAFFHWNALLPILLITLCSLAPFVLDTSATASRLGIYYLNLIKDY